MDEEVLIFFSFFFTFSNKKEAKVLRNAELDPSIIVVDFKKHDITPSTIHGSQKKKFFAISLLVQA